MSDGSVPAQELATAITLSVALAEGRSLVLQTYLGRDQPLEDYHRLLDALGMAADRQQARYKLENLRANLELHEKQLKHSKEDLPRVEAETHKRAQEAWKASGKKGDYKLTTQETQQLAAHKNNFAINTKRFEEEIAKLKVEIAACEKTIGAG